MKCVRCGKVFKENVEVCDQCGYEFSEGERIKKILDEKKDPEVPLHEQTNLIDYPILSFVFSILGLLIPIFIFSILAMKLGKKPARVKYQPFANVGYIFGILGIAISIIFISMIIFIFMG